MTLGYFFPGHNIFCSGCILCLFIMVRTAGGIEVSWLSPHVHGEGRHCAPHYSVVVLSSFYFFWFIGMYIQYVRIDILI
jgi:hypothetical protein